MNDRALIDATLAHVPSITKTLQALAAMEQQLDDARTYEEIRRIVQRAEALRVLGSHIAEVKQKAEWVILIANQRIGEEIKKVPKASGGDQRSNLPRREDSKPGREALGIPPVSRFRLTKLASLPRDVLRTFAESLWQTGKDATLKAVLGENREVEIRQQRAAYEARAERGGTVDDLVALAASGQKFNVIYPDPPWEYWTFSEKGKQRSNERYYDVLSLDAIKALPVAQLAAKDCALLLWVTQPHLPSALEVIASWGFEYKTDAFVWIKTTPTATEVTLDGTGLHWGMGHYTRCNSEAVLLATKGSPQRMAKDVHQVILAPVGEHSQKPEEARRRIERLFLGPYLELFARAPVAGWTVWGNEVDGVGDASGVPLLADGGAP
jgi:N6-adenosine-specific RNA methylase IME4